MPWIFRRVASIAHWLGIFSQVPRPGGKPSYRDSDFYQRLRIVLHDGLLLGQSDKPGGIDDECLTERSGASSQECFDLRRRQVGVDLIAESNHSGQIRSSFAHIAFGIENVFLPGLVIRECAVIDGDADTPKDIECRPFSGRTAARLW